MYKERIFIKFLLLVENFIKHHNYVCKFCHIYFGLSTGMRRKRKEKMVNFSPLANFIYRYNNIFDDYFYNTSICYKN
jgi:hypothetical protein